MASGTTTSGGVADRYATALYAQADETGAIDQTVSEMDSLGKLIDQSADMRRLLSSPLIDVTQARGAADAVLEQQGFGKLVRDFVGVVANNRRLACAATDRRPRLPPWSPTSGAWSSRTCSRRIR